MVNVKHKAEQTESITDLMANRLKNLDRSRSFLLACLRALWKSAHKIYFMCSNVREILVDGLKALICSKNHV